jgi:phenylpropionate dioxygenase-like ring-hydroxylating dioxygenase large terminal subunit
VIIEAALRRATARPSGNWFVLAASREVTGARPFGRTVAGQEIVAWRTEDGRLHAGPGACPHLGAPLSEARVHCGELVCRWHGMRLGERGSPRWAPLPAHDDGVLAWVRLDEVGGETPLPEPVVPLRPPQANSIDAVATAIGVCEPEDVVANRLDPWHGAWFHPYSFANLRVLDAPPARLVEDGVGAGVDRFDVEVSFRLSRRIGVPVRASFTCPEPRTVVMHIVEGEGAGSVVETHATPLGTNSVGRPTTAVIEATVAHSQRTGFRLARGGAPAVRALMRWAAARLWRDDLAYAERRYELRSRKR